MLVWKLTTQGDLVKSPCGLWLSAVEHSTHDKESIMGNAGSIPSTEEGNANLRVYWTVGSFAGRHREGHPTSESESVRRWRLKKDWLPSRLCRSVFVLVTLPLWMR